VTSPREKDLRVEEDEPERIRKQIFAEKQFHNRGPAEANIRCYDVDVLDLETIRSLRYRENEVGDQRLHRVDA